MEDLNDKVLGGNLPAIEWNQVPSEIQNVIENLGISLSNGDLNQLGKAIAAGWRDFEHTREDPDLEAIRDDPEFEKLLEEREVDVKPATKPPGGDQ